MISYKYVPAGDESHGHLHVYEDDALLATKEEWASLSQMGGEARLRLMAEQANARVPGQMIPIDDPRLYTHCQWCGEPVDREAGQSAAWDAGQWHEPGCYSNSPHLSELGRQRAKRRALMMEKQEAK